MKIKFQVIPERCRGRNLHSDEIISAGKWKEISNKVRAASKGKCHCCGKLFDLREMNAHEVWEFDEVRGIQRLADIIAVCDKCHQTIHYHYLFSGQRITARERDEFICKAHYMEVNHCSLYSVELAIDEALKAYRRLNQLQIEWKLDISYAIENNWLDYEEVSIDNLEKIAPHSGEFILLYRNHIWMPFNAIPSRCMIDTMERRFESKRYIACQMCGKEIRRWYAYHDLRIPEDSVQMLYKGSKTVCKLCRDTMLQGAKKWFLKYRKSTRHYMKVNNCTYVECLEHAKKARKSQKRRDLQIWLNTPELPAWASKERDKYLIKNGAIFDAGVKKWYLYPNYNLKKFRPYL